MKNITLTLLTSVIIDTVKVETHIKGLNDKAADERLNRAAYQQSAGDDDEHERKLHTTMVSAAESLSTYFGDYITSYHQSSGDNAVIIDYSDTSKIVYKLTVSDRFNERFTESLARLSSQFISNEMLRAWYLAINPNLSDIYNKNSATILSDINHCFNKLAPKAPVIPFTKHLTLDREEVIIEMPKDFFRAEHDIEDIEPYIFSVGYVIDDNVIDDIEFEGSKRGVYYIEKPESGVLTITPCGIGSGKMSVYSRHMESLTRKDLNIIIRYNEV